MSLILGLLSLFIPRVVIAFLWFFTTWFNGVFETRAWPILGFLFLPLTLLWYSVVENWYAGAWNPWQIAVVVLAVFLDLNSTRRPSRK